MHFVVLAVSEGRRLALTQAASSSPPARDSFKTKAWGCLSRSVRPSPIEPAILGRLPCAAQGETVRRRNGIAADITLGDAASAAHHFVLRCARETRGSA